MKPWHTLIPIVIAAAGFGAIRQATLSGLERENAKLEQASASWETSNSVRPRRSGFPDSAKQEIQTIARDLRAAEESTDPEASLKGQELRTRLTKQLATADHQTVLKLIEEASAGMDESRKTAMIRSFVHALIQARPGESIMLLEALPEYERKTEDIMVAFLRCLPGDPALVVRAFERLDAYNSPAIRDEQIVRASFRAQARVEPEIAVARLLSPRGIEILPDLQGLNLGDELRDSQEHHAFLSALRTEGMKFPGSARLESVRAGYLQALRQKMEGWPSEEALRIIKTEFTPKEQRQYVSFLHAPEDPQKWADWVAEMDWDDKLNHPIGSFIRSWANTDSAGAGAWIEQQPDNPVRNEAIDNYALQLSATLPGKAAEAALLLPPGRDRNRTLKVISKKWKEQDPVAYAAFASRNGLAP